MEVKFSNTQNTDILHLCTAVSLFSRLLFLASLALFTFALTLSAVSGIYCPRQRSTTSCLTSSKACWSMNPLKGWCWATPSSTLSLRTEGSERRRAARAGRATGTSAGDAQASKDWVSEDTKTFICGTGGLLTLWRVGCSVICHVSMDTFDSRSSDTTRVTLLQQRPKQTRDWKKSLIFCGGRSLKCSALCSSCLPSGSRSSFPPSIRPSDICISGKQQS